MPHPAGHSLAYYPASVNHGAGREGEREADRGSRGATGEKRPGKAGHFGASSSGSSSDSAWGARRRLREPSELINGHTIRRRRQQTPRFARENKAQDAASRLRSGHWRSDPITLHRAGRPPACPSMPTACSFPPRAPSALPHPCRLVQGSPTKVPVI